MHFFSGPRSACRGSSEHFSLVLSAIYPPVLWERKSHKPTLCTEDDVIQKGQAKKNKQLPPPPTVSWIHANSEAEFHGNLHPLEGLLKKLTLSECVDERPSLTFVKIPTYAWPRPENTTNILPVRPRKTETEAAVRRDPYEYCAGCERRRDVFLVSSCNPPARVWAVLGAELPRCRLRCQEMFMIM